MSRTSNRANGDVIRDFLSVADLLKEPPLAQLYAYLARKGESTVQELMDALDLAQGTAYTYVNRLVDAGVIEGVPIVGVERLTERMEDSLKGVVVP